MTLLTTFAISPISCGRAVAPRELALADLTIVVPVKNNQIGVTRLLEACQKIFPLEDCPAEIVIVDNLSHPPVEIPPHLDQGPGGVSSGGKRGRLGSPFCHDFER